MRCRLAGPGKAAVVREAEAQTDSPPRGSVRKGPERAQGPQKLAHNPASLSFLALRGRQRGKHPVPQRWEGCQGPERRRGGEGASLCHV